ncbi:hypothetical protein ACTXT7_014807 [Hymenolepis weldensis]
MVLALNAFPSASTSSKNERLKSQLLKAIFNRLEMLCPKGDEGKGCNCGDQSPDSTSQGGHGGSTDDEIFVPFFAWGAGITNIPNSNKAFSLLAQQNSVSTLVASLLSTLIPSYSQVQYPSSDEAKQASSG